MLVLARGVRSTDEGRAVLDLLDPAEQLRACVVWARVPATRPIAFERLAALAADSTHLAATRSSIRALSARPDLLPWLRMHGLLDEPDSPSRLN